MSKIGMTIKLVSKNQDLFEEVKKVLSQHFEILETSPLMEGKYKDHAFHQFLGLLNDGADNDHSSA